MMKTLQKGDKAPDFKGVDQFGNSIALSDFKDKKLILFFYPKASTPGCTLEAQSMRDSFDVFKRKGYEIVGVSADTVKQQKNFCDKNLLPYPLIADTDKNIIMNYGVWGEKKFMGRTFDGILRTTFVINEYGIIDEIISKVETKNHATQLFKIIDIVK